MHYLPFKIVIPARYGSTRLPGKPLLDLAGEPMIVHVCRRALESGADEVIVATDDTRIVEAVIGLPVRAMLTSDHHNSGTERIAEVAERSGWPDETVVVNLQGDEPLITPALMHATAEALAQQQRAGIATLCAPIHERAEVFNPHAVKVVLDQDGYALYFSRAPIPWDRGGFADESAPLSGGYPYYRHIGLYAYTVNFLRRYVAWPPSRLEHVEALEQLRILWHGEAIRVLPVEQVPEAGVDTLEDLARVARALQGK
ncbi:MAG: 3-deoxy-manno-octulosonate cytidylyltransferase [Methylococcaceae bacterium]|nr:MAG: 3-deoxy-manno-octulosonate cytidylyltransferase [Methylococcaceae bacterium]